MDRTWSDFGVAKKAAIFVCQPISLILSGFKNQQNSRPHRQGYNSNIARGYTQITRASSLQSGQENQPLRKSNVTFKVYKGISF